MAVKLYGSKQNEKPGMLVSTVKEDNCFDRVIQAGDIPQGEVAQLKGYANGNEGRPWVLI